MKFAPLGMGLAWLLSVGCGAESVATPAQPRSATPAAVRPQRRQPAADSKVEGELRQLTAELSSVRRDVLVLADEIRGLARRESVRSGVSPAEPRRESLAASNPRAVAALAANWQAAGRLEWLLASEERVLREFGAPSSMDAAGERKSAWTYRLQDAEYVPSENYELEFLDGRLINCVRLE